MIYLSKKLTLKQKKFADEYIICGNATEAAIKAGYSKKYTNTNANKLLQNTTVKKYIDERLEEIDNKKIMDQKEVLELLTRIARGEEVEEILALDGTGGQEPTEIEVSMKDRIKAAELLGKRYGMWTDKVDMTGNIELIFEDDYGDEDD